MSDHPYPDGTRLNAVRNRLGDVARLVNGREGTIVMSSRLAGSGKQEVKMDALSLLKEDHDKVRKMLQELESTTERGVKTREELFTKVKHELTVHEAIEEEIFYPALKQHPRTRDIALEAYEEHHVVDTVMAEIEHVAYDDETWGAKFKVMKENLDHHIEEEEREMFKQAKQVFEPGELTQLGESMKARKEELLSQQTPAA